MSTTRWGTAYFTSQAAAVAYYQPYGLEAADILVKLAAGEIHIGIPPLKEGQRAVIIDNGKRYAIEEDAS